MLLTASSVVMCAQWDSMVNFPLTSFPIPNQITVGPDNALWFTGKGSAVGKLTPSGVATEYGHSAPSGSGKITVGSDKALWFTIGLARSAASRQPGR
jgi:streptogramin lyase